MVTAGTNAEVLRNLNEPPIVWAAVDGTLNKFAAVDFVSALSAASILLARLFHKPIKSEVFPLDTLCLDIFVVVYSRRLVNKQTNKFVVIQGGLKNTVRK